MDLSPCRVVKMKLHNRIETYTTNTRNNITVNSQPETVILPPIIKRKYINLNARKRHIESYKPSSQLYQKLNARISIRKLEFEEIINTKIGISDGCSENKQKKRSAKSSHVLSDSNIIDIKFLEKNSRELKQNAFRHVSVL